MKWLGWTLLTIAFVLAWPWIYFYGINQAFSRYPILSTLATSAAVGYIVAFLLRRYHKRPSS